MSSALWHFFWDSNDWGGAPPAPSPAPAVAQDSGSGGGTKSREDYFPANDDFWEARATYLRSLQQEMALDLPPAAIEPDLPPAPKPKQPKFADWRALPRLQAERTAAISRVEAAPNLLELRAHGQRLLALNTAVQRARAAQADYERHLRVTKRNRQIARAKKALATLMVAQTLLRLIFR